MHFGPCLCNIRCRCGHLADLDEFSVEPSRYRCPACGVAWRVEPEGVARMTPSGFVLPAPNRIVIE
jgi:hypothetical protein